MIKWGDLYTVLTAVVPLYVAMILAYGSVRWWRIFTADQCSGINRFVAVFAVPLLSFHFISSNNPYSMNLRFIAADSLQKLATLAGLAVWSRLRLRRSDQIDWTITLFSLSTLPNTLVMGIPLLIAMYGEYSGSLMVQVVVLQCIIWYTFLLFLFEYRAARTLIADQFPGGGAAAISSVKVDADVVSLDGGGRGSIQADAEVGGDGRIHVTVRKSTSSRRSAAAMVTPRPSNLTGAEIYSLGSSRNPTPRGSNFNHSDFYAAMAAAAGRPSSFGLGENYSSRGETTRHSHLEEHPLPNDPDLSATTKKTPPLPPYNATTTATRHDAKELHMFVWSSSGSPASDVGGLPVFGDSGAGVDISAATADLAGAKEIRMLIPADLPSAKGATAISIPECEDFRFRGTRLAEEEEEDEQREQRGRKEPEELSKLGSTSTAELRPKDLIAGEKQEMPPASVMTRLILIMVWRKLIRNPNTYSSLIGLIWSLIAFRWEVTMPKIVQKSISILSDAGLGMAMFSLGLFMALQPRIIACGDFIAIFSMVVRFFVAPAVMAAVSLAVGLRGSILHIAIVQAALPQGIVPFVFAKEYNVHPAILSTAVIFGMLIALPITLIYYILLGL